MSKSRFSIMVFLQVLLLAGPVGAQEDLGVLIEEALQHPLGVERYQENFKFGIRGVTLYEFALSPSHPGWLYLASNNGFAFATRDAGMSWTEGRLIVKRKPFFGSLRPSLAPRGAPFSAGETLSALQSWGYLKDSVSNRFAFSDGSTNVSFLDLDPGGPAFWGLPNPGLTRAGDRKLRDVSGGRGEGADMARYGIGLTTGAPRLGALLKKRGKRPAGMNLQLLLSLRGVEPTWINMIAVDPSNPERALAATSMGVFETQDGGYAWGNTFPGRNLRERSCRFIAFHPTDKNRVFLGTAQGLLVSTDGGRKFQRVTGTQLSSVLVYWVTFYGQNPNIIYAGSNVGAFRSDDGGVNWRWIFFETLPAQNRVRSVAVDPKNPDRVTLATEDGMFRSGNGGQDWERSGAFLFTSDRVYRVVADPLDSNHLFAITGRNVWETTNWGDTWEAVYLTDSEWSPRSLRYDPLDPSVLWLVTSNELIKISTQPPEPISGASVELLRSYLDREPGLSELMDTTFRNMGVHRGELGEMRARARMRGLVPRLNVFAGIFSVDDAAYLNPVYLVGLPQAETEVVSVKYDVTMPYYGVVLNWDLQPLIFYMEEVPYGRYFKQANAIYLNLKFEVQRLFEERRRLLILLFVHPTKNQTLHLNRMLRFEELTAHLNALSGGVYEHILGQIEQGNFAKEMIR
jgi:photosystem II stability/assembly factor-like uncharacterized protein